MADDILSQFLVKIAYQQDEKSRQKFDDGLKQIQTRAAEFGAKIGELPTIVSEATKRISASLSDLWYASQKTGASAEQIDALRRAATQSGEGADNAERSWNGFSETLRKFGAAAGRQLKTIFDIDYDPNDKFGAFLQARAKFAKEYNEATDNVGKGRALARAEALNLGGESAVKGRQDIFSKYFEKQLIRNSGLEGEKAAALTRAYNAWRTRSRRLSAKPIRHCSISSARCLIGSPNGSMRIRSGSSSFSPVSRRKSGLFLRILPNSARRSCSYGMR